MTQPKPTFTLPERKYVLCDSCGKRKISTSVRIIDRRVVCRKCKREGRA